MVTTKEVQHIKDVLSLVQEKLEYVTNKVAKINEIANADYTGVTEGDMNFAHWYINQNMDKDYSLQTIRYYTSEQAGQKINPVRRQGIKKIFTAQSLDEDIAWELKPLADRLREKAKANINES